VRHLFVTQDFPPDRGGMARRHVELCRRFGDEPLVVSTVDAPGASAFDAGERYPIERQPFGFAEAKRFLEQMRWSRWLAKACARGADVMHCGNVRPCGYAVWVAHRRTRTPYLLYVNGGDLLRERAKARASLAKRASARAIFGDACGVVANSAWTAELARDVMREVGCRAAPPVAAIDLGTDPAQFSPSRDRGTLRERLGLGDAPVVLTVARLVPHKGQDVGIRAIARLAAERPALRYVLVGEGHDEARLRELARSLGVAGRVVFAGALSDEDVAEAYATATVYLGASRVDDTVNVEGFGISFVEAGASGVPSVAGDSGGVSSAVRDGETGLLVPPADVERVSDALARLLDDDALRHRMGAAARRAVESHYNWDRVARETLAFARETCARGRAA
jgi:phosphatidylinositol alpha-1,6-mannosyltransferase